MSVPFYKFVYRLGFTPWERLATLPASKQILDLFDSVERGRQPPFGSALELGCGNGNWSVRLAARGWNVTGVDIVAKAVRTARERAREAGQDVHFIHGDVTALRTANVGSCFQLVLDMGTVHGLTPPQREAVGRDVNAVSAADATLLMYAFAPARRGPLPRGMSWSDIEATYQGWTIVDEIAFDMTGMPDSVKKDDPRWYRLSRNEPSSDGVGLD